MRSSVRSNLRSTLSIAADARALTTYKVSVPTSTEKRNIETFAGLPSLMTFPKLVGLTTYKVFVPTKDREISKIKVHYKGLSKRYDEVIERHDFEQRVASVQLNYAKEGKTGPAIV